MAITLRAQNFAPNNIKARTTVDADALSGSTTVTVKNSADISSGDFAVLGTAGGPSSEIVSVVSIAGQVATLGSATKELHKRQEPFMAVYADKLRLYSAAVPADGSIPADGSFAAVGSPVAITADQTYTLLTDPAGSTSFWYKYTYFNSSSSAETSLADAVAVRGGNYGHYVTTFDIRTEAGMTEAALVPDTLIAMKRDDAEGEINGALAPVFSLPFSYPYPQMVVSITRWLAAGLLLVHQYGIEPNESSKDGTVLINMARDYLDRIINREITLLDYRQQAIASVPVISGWPNALTALYDQNNPDSTDPIGGDRKFRIGKTF